MFSRDLRSSGAANYTERVKLFRRSDHRIMPARDDQAAGRPVEGHEIRASDIELAPLAFTV
ncbi:hypothetical protein [Ancylobacter oerskovii]|uniref:Uncharacterized protein n=1 Tax=Ancylobacter oerskovii TaxID=459519 RepID=A0ABW4YRS3_9HYPH|nr:hypothetical protein [Ancylobacter oerskovii]MBS7545699.1 hypothetical protein [Ancylobacter oerskovii]